jgi:hypothetical protein
MRRVFVAALLIGLALACPGWAAEKAGVRVADTLTFHGQPLVLNGLGVREATIFNVDVYVAGLYVAARSSDPATLLRADQSKVLHLVFVRDVERDKIAEAWSEGFEKNAGARLTGLKSRVAELGAFMTDMKKGSTLTFSYAENQGVEVRVNGASKGTIAGQDFADVFFAIWLGPYPPNAGLKTGLLGKG